MYNNGKTRLYNVLMGNPSAGNAIGRTVGLSAGGATDGGDDNFFVKRGKSIENALGTTGAAIASKVYDTMENAKTDQLLKDAKTSMNDIAKKYGYNTWSDWQDAYQAAKDAGDTARVAEMEPQLKEFQAQANINAGKADEKAVAYKDYAANNYVSQKINQDRGKFAGSAINTLSTAADVTGLTANPLANAVQGGIEGLADELEQNGFENFSAERAGQNALIGATTGAVTGALNMGISNSLAKRAAAKGLTGTAAEAGIGQTIRQGAKTIAGGAARGALSGAVGGATGAGLSAAMNNQDVLGSALQGAVKGAQQGAVAGGVMAGVNMAPGIKQMNQKFSEAKQNWDQSGSNFDERLTNTLTSGDSAVGDWLMNKRQSKVLGAAGNLGNRVQDVSGTMDSSQHRALADEAENLIKSSWDANHREDEIRSISAALKNLDTNLESAQGAIDRLSTADDQVKWADRARTLTRIDEATRAIAECDRLLNDNAIGAQTKSVISSMRDELALGKEGLSRAWSQLDTGTPTTAKGWAKKAGQRIVEDINNSNLGNRVKDVSGDQYSDDINGMKVNRNDMLGYTEDNTEPVSVEDALRETNAALRSTPPQELSGWDQMANESGYATYDDVIKEFMAANPGKDVSAGAVLAWMDNNPGNWNPNSAQTKVFDALTKDNETEVVSSKTSREAKLKYAQGKELLRQYGAVDQPMARATKAPETFQKLAEMGFTKPEDVERIAGAVTGANGAVSTLNKSIIESAKPVNTFDGDEAGQTIDDFIDNSIEHNMLSGTNEGKAVKRGIKAYLKALPSRAEGSITSEDSAASTFKVVQGLEARAAELEGRGGSTYHRATTQDVHQAAVLKDVAKLLKDRIYDGANVEVAVTPTVVQNLKALDPTNKEWASTVDSFAASAKTPQDLRTFQKPFVRASRYIDNQYVQAATVGGRMAGNAGELPDILPTTKAGVVKQVVNNVWNSNPAHRARAAIYGKMAEGASAPVDAETPATQPGITTVGAEMGQEVQAPMQTPAVQTNTNYNPATQVYNAIGRTEGLNNAEQARTANYLVDAVQNQNTAGANNLESLAVPNASTTMYNTIYGTPVTSTQMATANTNTGYFQPTGDYWTDILAQAVSSAIDANDVAAFESLYGMYQDSLSNLQKQSSSDSSQQKLTATQQRANAAMNSLERLSQMTPDTAYNLSNIPLIGNIATLGGNDYESEAKSLAQQIGYMVSGSNIKDSEAENIGKSYVPQPWDNEQVRQNKLRRAYEIIQQYQNGYLEA